MALAMILLKHALPAKHGLDIGIALLCEGSSVQRGLDIGTSVMALNATCQSKPRHTLELRFAPGQHVCPRCYPGRPAHIAHGSWVLGMGRLPNAMP